MERLENVRNSLDRVSKEVEKYMKEDFIIDFQKKLFNRLNIKDANPPLTLVIGQEDIVTVMGDILSDSIEGDEIYCMANRFNLIKYIANGIIRNQEKILKFHVILSGEEGRKDDLLIQLDGFDPKKLDVRYLPKDMIGDMRVMFNKISGTFGIKFQDKGYIGVKGVESKYLKQLFYTYYYKAKKDSWIAKWEHPPKEISPNELINQLDILITKLKEYKDERPRFLYLVLDKARFLVDDDELLGKLKNLKKQDILFKLVLSKNAKESYEKLLDSKFGDCIILSNKITSHRYVVCNIMAADMLDSEFNKKIYLLFYDSHEYIIDEIKKFVEKEYIEKKDGSEGMLGE